MTQLTTLSVPDFMRSGLDEATRSLAGSSGGKQISIRGGVWRMVVGGEEIAKNEDRNLNIVILQASKGITRTYYEGTYEQGKDTPPVCWSAEGVVPNPEVPNPQSKSCETCKQNIEGSGEGKSRACRFSKRLAVALANDIGGNIYRLSVPAKSFFGRPEGDKMPLQAYAKYVAGNGIPITGLVTEARFDSDHSVPVMKFRAVRALTKDEWEVAKAQSQTDDARQATELKIVLKEPTAPVAPPAFAEAPPKPVDEPVKRTKAATPVPKNVADVLSDWTVDE